MAAYRILLTGFAPFLKHGVNTSQRVVERLAKSHLARRGPPGVELTTLVLPVEFDRAFELVRSHLDALPPDRRPHALVLMGMAARTRKVRLERLAVNLADCESFAAPGRRPVPRPDNAGAAPVDRPIEPGAPLALPARADVKALARELKAAGLPVELSLSAGSYVCNDIYYRALSHFARTGSDAACLFVHLPELPRPRPVRVLGIALPLVKRCSRDALALSVQVRAISALLAALARQCAGAGTHGARAV